jgi:hypothetical protein
MGYLEQTSIERDLVLDFFLRFSRFEFALKVSGFASGDHERVAPDWDRFAQHVAAGFDPSRTPKLARATRYYLNNPPMKQVLVDGLLAWSTDLPAKDDKAQLLIALVRRVRNNLFHGGKYNAEMHEETARKRELLRGGICILEECLRHHDGVRKAYEGAVM